MFKMKIIFLFGLVGTFYNQNLRNNYNNTFKSHVLIISSKDCIIVYLAQNYINIPQLYKISIMQLHQLVARVLWVFCCIAENNRLSWQPDTMSHDIVQSSLVLQPASRLELHASHQSSPCFLESSNSEQQTSVLFSSCYEKYYQHTPIPR